MKQLHLVIYTPEGKKFDDSVDFVQVYTSDSYLGILPEHAPLISDVKVSKLTVRKDGSDTFFAVGEGMLTIKNDELKLVVNSLEKASEIDLERAMAAKERAEKRLMSNIEGDEVDVARAKAALARALNRINISEKQL